MRVRQEDELVARLPARLDGLKDLRDGRVAARRGEVPLLAEAVEHVDHDRDIGHGQVTGSSRAFGR